jgi:2-oxoisovalerate dehydrogenase E1 component alpha subunit
MPRSAETPQAAGAAYALKRSAQRGQGRDKDCVIVYVGEGACSEVRCRLRGAGLRLNDDQGDFHAGMNMAAVLGEWDVPLVSTYSQSRAGGPLVMLVRNNSFAISTPAAQQFAGDGIASRAPGYGIEAVRVDGNDPLAVHLVCLEARRRAVEHGKPVLVEAMSYRVGHHSTSDDSSAYRSRSEVDSIKRQDNPLHRMRSYLEHRGLWSAEQEEATKVRQKKDVMTAFTKAERELKPPLSGMFEDVYGTDERPMREQREELRRIIAKYGEASEAWKTALSKHEGGGAL